MLALPKRALSWLWFASSIRSEGRDVVPYERGKAQQDMPNEPPSDNALMRKVAQGDEQALAQLYDRYAGTVLGIALKIVHQRELAEEVAQEAFWRVWQRADTFDTIYLYGPEGLINSWRKP